MAGGQGQGGGSKEEVRLLARSPGPVVMVKTRGNSQEDTEQGVTSSDLGFKRIFLLNFILVFCCLRR